MVKTNISAIRDVMLEMGIRPRKRWGQNFLKERGILELMVRAAAVGPDDLVLEIGPGPGCLTEVLLQAGATIVAVEIDAKMIELARKLLGEQSRVLWQHIDFLDRKNRIDASLMAYLRREIDAEAFRGLKVVSNLPYNISVPALLNLLESRLSIDTMVVTVQNEVADRLLAKPGSASYGSVSVLVSLLAGVRRLRRVNASAFWPPPKVASSVIEVIPRAAPPLGDDVSYATFKKIVKAIFAHRRKGWFKSLAMHLGVSDGGRRLRDGYLHRGHDLARRAESLAYQEIVELARVAGELGI